MLTSMKKQRSVRSFKSLLGSGTDYDADILNSNASVAQSMGIIGEPMLKALHLPASLPSAEHLSPGLWTWTHATGGGSVNADTLHLAAAQTRLYSANGAALEFPEHLRDVPSQLPGDDLRGPVGGRALPGMIRPGIERAMSGTATQGSVRSGKVNRRPVSAIFPGHEPEGNHKIRRFYLQMDDLRLKSSTNAQSVVCRVQIGHQRPCSSILNLKKEASKGFGLVNRPKEGFIFDVDDHDPRVLIRIHGLPAGSRLSSDMSSSPSFDMSDNASFRPKLGLLSGLRRSPTASSFRLDAMGGSGTSTPSTVPNSATVEAGPLLGEVMFTIPSHISHNKIPAEYVVMSSNAKKEIAKLTVRMGAYVDEDYIPEPECEPSPPEPEFGDYLNFLISTPGASIWRKYWCVLGENELQIYDFEYRETKPVSRIPLPHIIQIAPADPELIYAPNCIELSLSRNFSFSDSIPDWTARVVDARPGSTDMVVYVTADAPERMVVWMDKIAREKARMAGAGTPVPPPRKLAASRAARKPVAAVA
ncbi:hypothetical protein PhCBS80983_g00333 [Powellomyces hirtus]|uniref:PH domain-containing protein n=1 Tax=Powellomyces hirtus TaxID=109895 RepID=A0A507EFL8_9FUNG|nr:hypothetical protein PhCBS80983_g00333 [Powellomyces hirtus]